MRLSLFSDYSLRVLLFGAVKGSAFPLHEVADAYNISRHHLVKVVNNLTKQGYLSTRRGRGGGIELAMKPEEIMIGRLVRKTETSIPLVECFDPSTNTCPIHGCCGLKGALAQAVGAFYGALDRYTLKDIMDGNRLHSMKDILLAPKLDRLKTLPNGELVEEESDLIPVLPG
ncbi:MAG: Rrf2 family transcriptional regulator [Verrucomicrobiota bacterium]